MSDRIDKSEPGQAAQAELQACLRRHFGGAIPKAATRLNDLDLDSLELIEILFELEQRSEESLSNAQLEALSTVGDLMRCFGISPREHGGVS